MQEKIHIPITKHRYNLCKEFLKIKMHFNNKKSNYFSNYFKDEFYIKQDKFIAPFFDNISIPSFKVFCIFLFYAKDGFYNYSQQKEYFLGTELKNFKHKLYYIQDTLEEDLCKVQKISFEELRTLYFKKEIHTVTFYVLMKTIFKHRIQDLENSSMYEELWYKDCKLMKFIKFKKRVIMNFVNKVR